MCYLPRKPAYNSSVALISDWHTVWQLLSAIPHEEEAHEAHSLFGEVAAIGSFAFAQFMGLILGLGFQVIWLMRDITRRVNVTALGEMVKKLVDAGNTERAMKLCAATNAPAAMILRVGLEALSRKLNPREAMRELLPKYLKVMRSGYRGTLIIGVIAFAEGLSLFARGMKKGVGEEFTTLMLIMLGALAILGTLNAIRWGRIQRELEYVCELLA